LLAERLGQPFLIENRAGAAGNIATEAVVRAAAGGYMLLHATCINTINATLYEQLAFDFARDMAPLLESHSRLWLLSSIRLFQ
jgi:tripartite-type tricarboxylate transporter receptor subunit TctC